MTKKILFILTLPIPLTFVKAADLDTVFKEINNIDNEKSNKENIIINPNKGSFISIIIIIIASIIGIISYHISKAKQKFKKI